MKKSINPKTFLLRAVFLLLFAFPLLANAQYTQFAYGTSASPAENYIYVGELTLDPSIEYNNQKLKVSIVGETETSATLGETTYYIANRSGLAVNQVVIGGVGVGNNVLQCYQNGTTYSFYLYLPSTANWYTVAVSAFLISGFSTAGTAVTTINPVLSTGPPPGTNVPLTMINPIMSTDVAGNVSIGTTKDPAGFKFAVNGGIEATAVTVKGFGSWPDYIFKTGYPMRSLPELKNYIELNHHLPDMPSAEDVAKNGLNLGEMDKLLTKKVEELTLYLIHESNANKDADMKLKVLQQQLADQQNEIDKLKSVVNSLLKLKQTN